MRFSTVSHILCGAVAVSAATIPRSASLKRDSETVDLSQFGNGFQTLSPEDAKAAADDTFDPSLVTKPDQVTSATNAVDGEPAAAAADTCTNPTVRVEWRDMADSDKTAFLKAVNCLLKAPSAGNFPGSQNRYEDIVVVHQQMTGSIHMVQQFLPWHRYYLNIYESILRDECSYAGPMPWWDETKDAGSFANSPLFTDQWFGRAPLKTADGQGTCITSGAFAGLTLHIGPGSGNSDHCLSRAVDESATQYCSSDFVAQCATNSNYTNYEKCNELGPHAYGHNGLGAVMSEVSASPGDPAFFMHHSFVDHMWRMWQTADSEDRLYQINGDSTTTDPKQPLTLAYKLSSMGLRPDVTVQDVMDTTGGYLCYRYSY
ncbi:uncharacterized protein BCR38DRAFT_334658 [Pseudomassariella vexata]|uniref:Tyrosinase copper-binding domain-containing protein n=1 Tax=Pseudomassariella vexata TaxID=1141098 RepID=A0A1Y2EC43_9PEZI|nr:uncharacterized protein BCR38DRAFT_334658 [Pseudomassariella vexata]ORY68415.1 hypothetical protein BCR38DRAFT_334658 [Pseudomassariella vexata]